MRRFREAALRRARGGRPRRGPKREREEEEAPEEPPRFAPMTKAEKRRKKAAAPVPDPDARLSAKPNKIVDAE